jgi:D-hydroxyproline dehydrogenase subunit beta
VRSPPAPDVAIIGGGIAGCAVAALLAEAGARVRLYEREAIAAGASGRNSGILQHPMDAALVPLYEASLELYASLGHGFRFPPEPVGVLVVSDDAEALAAEFEEDSAKFPELAPEWIVDAAAVEPALSPGLFAYRLATGRPVPPAAATRAWAERARAAGAVVEVGQPAGLAQRGGRVQGVRAGGRTEMAGAVVVAAGPWTSKVVAAAAVSPIWGVVAQVRLAVPPRHAIEEAGVKTLSAPIFTIVTEGGVSSVGSTFTVEEPDAASVAPLLLERGARFLPALRGAAIEHVRACARPMSADGRPLLGPVPGVEGLHLLTGHGAWGVTLGPASARLVADGVLGRPASVPPELAAARF